jgi:hypothetical protein
LSQINSEWEQARGPNEGVRRRRRRRRRRLMNCKKTWKEGHGLITALSRHMLVRTEENEEKSQESQVSCRYSNPAPLE